MWRAAHRIAANTNYWIVIQTLGWSARFYFVASSVDEAATAAGWTKAGGGD